MQTEIEFTLPRGYVDQDGNRHQSGTMRLATARDEIEPMRDVQVRQNQAYLTVLLLARTITRLGTITNVTPEVVEGLYAADFDHLQRLYERLNSDGESVGVVSCPECSHRFEVDLTEIEDGRLGE
jgi:Phage tail assembly chaperone proteins, E, or 41 or 14